MVVLRTIHPWPTEELFARESFEELPGGETSSIPAVVAWAEAAVRKGIRGDMQAWSLVADRIEGKVATRRDDDDPEDECRRGDIQATIEAVVVGNARLNVPTTRRKIRPRIARPS